MANFAEAKQQRLRVGISIFVRKKRQSLWENGIFQNCVFLAMLLSHSPLIESACLVIGGADGTAEDARDFLIDSPFPLVDMQEALCTLDLLIEMSAQLDREWIVRFRERGGKVVSMRVGNDYVIDCERMIFDLPPALLVSGAPYNAVWTLPEYETTCASYYSTLFRAPVYIVPHIWSPFLLEKAVGRLQVGCHFGYDPGRLRWRVGVFEPNICSVKTSFIPMMCCESAHRENADVLEKIWVYNTLKLKEHPAFINFSLSLDVVKHGLASFEARYPFVDLMASNVDAVICHQWENSQNYLYYETLYGNYPLIHNSFLMGGCGYHYNDFDVEQGGVALLRAFALHDANLASYKRNACTFLKTLDPENETNVRAYSAAISALYGSQTAQSTAEGSS